MRTIMMGLLAGLALAACNDNKKEGDGLDRVNDSQQERVKAEADQMEKRAEEMKERADKTDDEALKARADGLEKDARSTKKAADDSKKVDDEKYGDGVQGRSPDHLRRTTTKKTTSTTR